MHSRPNNPTCPGPKVRAAFKNRGSFLCILDAGHFLHDFLKRALTKDLTFLRRKNGITHRLESRTWQKLAFDP